MWLTAGVVLGAGGTVWSRRRLSVLAERARRGQLSGDVLHLVDRGARRVQRHVASAVEAGRLEAHRRRGELMRTMQPRVRH
jgi:hypothetical protein